MFSRHKFLHIIKNYNSQHVLRHLIEEWREYLDKDFFVGEVMTDLSKVFDCILHDLLIAKLELYSLGEKSFSYIYSYLTNRNPCVRMNDTKSDFQKIISGAPQGSIARPILFNFSINDLFFFVSSASMYHFADDNSLSAAAKAVTELKNTLQSESEVVINWFRNNKMIVNPEKFQAIALDKQKHDYSNDTIKFDNKTVEAVSSVRFLGMQLDDKLNFSLHASNICKSAANQLSAILKEKEN